MYKRQVVTPRKDGVEVDLKELVDELQLRDVAAPMLVRFPDILLASLKASASCAKSFPSATWITWKLQASNFLSIGSGEQLSPIHI